MELVFQKDGLEKFITHCVCFLGFSKILTHPSANKTLWCKVFYKHQLENKSIEYLLNFWYLIEVLNWQDDWQDNQSIPYKI